MVFYFTPRGHGPGPEDWLLYMVRWGAATTAARSPPPLNAAARHPHTPPQGADKYENEDLIKHALPHDVWYHVDALSSAHVYLRLPEGAAPRPQGSGGGRTPPTAPHVRRPAVHAAGKTMADIPKETMEDACQLVKANSIQARRFQTAHDAAARPHARAPLPAHLLAVCTCACAGQQDQQPGDRLHARLQPAQER